MPTYDLVCSNCGHKFSVFCTISQRDQQKCLKCESSQVVQRFTGVNISGSKFNSGGVPSPRKSGFS